MNGKQEKQTQADRWAELIESNGLSSVALSLLEIVDTFGFLGHQALLALEPLVRDVSNKQIEQAAHLWGNSEVRAHLRNRLIRGHSSDE